MNRINQVVTLLALSGLALLQAACSKQQPVKMETAPPAAATLAAPTAPVAAAEPKPMDMPMAKDVPSGVGKNAVHHVAAVVKGVDVVNGSVTLSHGPVATLNWPAMTMGFKVRDKALMDRLAKDKQVDVDFVQDGSDYVVTAVK